MGFGVPGRRARVALAAAACLVAPAVLWAGYGEGTTAPPVAAVTNGANGFAGLHSANGITAAGISGSTYALVTSQDVGGSVQVIGMASP